MERQSLIVLIAVVAVAVECSALDLECPILTHLTLQEDGRKSTPPLVDSVTASSLLSSAYEEEELFAFSYPSTLFAWCGAKDRETDYITVTLTEPVVLYGLLSGGYYYDIVVRYVTAFSMQYAANTSSNLLPLLSDDGDGSIMVFNVSEQESISMILLPQPIVVQTINFQIVDYNVEGSTFNSACWTLALYGCTLFEAHNRSTHSVSPTPTQTPILSPCSESLDSPQVEAGRKEEETANTSEAVGIAVSTAVLTAVAVAVLVAVGVGLCWAITHGHILAGDRRKEWRRGSGTLRRVQNELYSDVPSSPATTAGPRLTHTTADDGGLYAVPLPHEEQVLKGYEPVQPNPVGEEGDCYFTNPKSAEVAEPREPGDSFTENAAYLSSATVMGGSQALLVSASDYELITAPHSERYQQPGETG